MDTRDGLEADALSETVDKAFAALPQGEPTGAPAGLESDWSVVTGLGLPLAMLSEEEGGFGLAPAQALSLLKQVGRHAAPGPIAEAMIGNWLLARAGMPPHEGPLTFAITDDVPVAPKMELKRVPWGRGATVAIMRSTADGGEVALLPAGIASVAHGTNLALEQRDTLTVASSDLAFQPAVGANRARALAAAARAIAMAGAAERVLELALDHANQRQQFGRPIGKFQAIQHSLAMLAGQVAATGAAAALAVDGVASDSKASIAAGKARASEAAGTISSIAHQVHGAMGFSREHALHLFTTRLLAWRDEFGSETEWNRRLGRAMLARGADAFWPAVVRP